MERISPQDFTGPRAYFTSFDYRIVSRAHNLSALQTDVERKLKILLLIKARIVCAASHLSSPIAYALFSKNSVLLDKSLVVPALRSDKTGVAHALEGKLPKDRQNEACFYDDNVRTTVSWDFEDNSAWFRDRFLTELEDEHSLIRYCLKDASPTTIDSLISSVKASPLLGRQEVEALSQALPLRARDAFLSYRELVYHMSGARVINCESSLPQENYIDYDLADLQQNRTKLSEEHIFWKLFVELALESFQRRMLPIELLDLLSFDDIFTIRTPLLESSFQTAYDELVQTVIRGIQNHTSPTLLLDLNKLETIRQKIEQTFNAVFDDQLMPFLRKRTYAQGKHVAGVGSSVGLGLLGFVPGVGQLASGVSVLKDSPALLFNLGQLGTSVHALWSMDAYTHSRDKALKASLNRIDISDKSAMLDMVDLLTSSLSERIRL